MAEHATKDPSKDPREEGLIIIIIIVALLNNM